MSKFADTNLDYITITSKTKPLPQDSIDYLKGLSRADLIRLLGVKGAEQFQKDPKTWKRNLRQYSPDIDKPEVPSRFIKT